MNVNATQRYSPAFGNLAFNTEFSLLRVGVLIVWLTAEKHAQRRNRSGMRNVDAELGQVRRRNAGRIARGGRGALNFALGEQSLENRRRTYRRSGQRHKGLCDWPHAIDQTKGLDDVSNLTVDGRVEDAVTRADDSLMVLKRVPGKGEAWSKIVFVRGQSSILRVEFITDADVQSEIRRHGPLVLHERGGKWTRIVIDGITKTLLIELRQSE